MANDSLNRTGESPPVIKGHDTRTLGPSDSSDSGSDIAGAPGLDAAEASGLQSGTTSDADHNRRGARKTAGPDIGDENLDSDSDSGGTGERGAAGRDAPPPTDQMLSIIDESGESELVAADELEDDRLVGDDETSALDVEANRASSPATRHRPAATRARASANQQQASGARRRGANQKKQRS